MGTTKDNDVKKIFIGWSGEHSKTIAVELKQVLENEAFNGELTCFVSTEDIASGDDWFIKIKNELNSSSYGIMCVTKDNVKAPWLYFETGALTGNGLKVVPLLINCDHQSLDHTPFGPKQFRQFYEEEQFIKLLMDIRKECSILLNLKDRELKQRFKTAYRNVKNKITPVLDEMRNKRYFSERYIFPNDVNTITMNTIYISAPMSAITEEEYEEQKRFLISLRDYLIQERGFELVVCPAIEKDSGEWDGITTAVQDNFRNLFQIQHLIVLYPKQLPTSSLIEIGYGIALCKNTVIFYKEDVPYMLRGAAQDIAHLHTRQFRKYDDIMKAIKSDKSLFEVKK